MTYPTPYTRLGKRGPAQADWYWPVLTGRYPYKPVIVPSDANKVVHINACDTTTGWAQQRTNIALATNTTDTDIWPGKARIVLSKNSGYSANKYGLDLGEGNEIDVSGCHIILKYKIDAAMAADAAATLSFGMGSAAKTNAYDDADDLIRWNVWTRANGAPDDYAGTQYQVIIPGTGVDFTTGSTNLESVRYFQFNTSTPTDTGGGVYATNAVHIDGIWCLAAPTKAQFVLTFDGAYISHYEAAQVLAKYGLRGTFFVYFGSSAGVDGGAAYLTSAQVDEMQAMGHCIAIYGQTWGDKTTAEKVSWITSQQARFAAAGWYSGIRHIVQGGTSGWGTDLPGELFPACLDSVTSGRKVGTSAGTQYMPNYLWRFHPIGASEQWDDVDDAFIAGDFANIIAMKAKSGMLFHAIDAGGMAALDTFCSTNLLGAINDGTLEVVTAAEAYESGMRLL